MRTLAGKANHIAPLVSLRSAARTIESTNILQVHSQAPEGCLSVKPVSPASMCFITTKKDWSPADDVQSRRFDERWHKVYGMVAYLLVERQVVSCYADPLNKDEEDCLAIVIGNETCWQAAECLNFSIPEGAWVC